MKNFKRVLSLALAALMVIGGLVVAPVDAKAETATFTQVTTVDAVKEGGNFVFVAKHGDKYYAMGTNLTTKPAAIEVSLDATTGLKAADGVNIPVWIVKKETTGLSFLNPAANKYMAGQNANATVETDTLETAGAIWTVTAGTVEGQFIFTAIGTEDATRRLSLNSTGDPIFRYYAGKVEDAKYQTELMIFKTDVAPEIKEDEPAPEVKPVTPSSPAADIVNAAYALTDGQSLEGTYTLEGKVTKVNTVYNAAYKNVTVTIQIGDLADKKIQCYRLAGDGINSISVGDTIKVEGKIKNFKGTIEFDAGCKLLSRVGELSVVPALKENATPSEIIVAANALGKWQALSEEVTMTGKIVKVDTEFNAEKKNITVTIQVSDSETDTILCYGLGAKDKNDEAELAKVAGLKVGDTIKVKGTIVNYNGTVEFSAPTLVEIVVVPEAGDFSIVLPLVLVLMGGAVVIVASKKRFA